MQIRSILKVHVPPPEAWKLLTDLGRVAPCFPGAEIGEALGDNMYRATFRVKLGPVSLSFAGKVGFVELDQERGLAVINASGTDTKGRGGAQGKVRCQFTADAGGTMIELDSSVELSGSIAQYGRGKGMISDLTQQLVNRFAANLERITATSVAQPEEVSSDLQTQPMAPQRANEDVSGLLFAALWRAVWRRFARLFGRAN